MSNLTRIRLTADRIMGIWVVRLYWDAEAAPDGMTLLDFHRLDMRDTPSQDHFSVWHALAERIGEDLALRAQEESGRPTE